MKSFACALCVAIALSAATAFAQSPASRAEADIKQVLTALVEAQRAFDQARMDALLAPDYIEISPVGEVDPRAKVLGFYAPHKKIAEPPAPTLDEISTRLYGDLAVTIARLSYTMKAPTGAQARAMRVVFVTRSTGGTWKIVSSQFTMIRN